MSSEDLVLDPFIRLEDLVDRGALDELCRSFYGLFGIPIRIYSRDGALLSDSTTEHPLCTYLNTLPGGRAACGPTVSAAKSKDPSESGDISHPCFTGAEYRIASLEYEGRKVGRLIIGPFVLPSGNEPPKSLMVVDSAIDPEKAKSLQQKMPRVTSGMVARVTQHLKAALDLILFGGHKAFMTSQMHLASVRENYRQLEDKTSKLQEAYDRLRELDRLKSNFLATVSHELRTPLTSIIGYSEMLTEGLAGPMPTEQHEFVKTIHEKGEQLLELIMSLLDLSKLESGTMALRKQRTSLAAIVSEATSTLAPVARKNEVTLTANVAPDLPPVAVDPDRLRQVLINLIDNALKFTPAGGRVTVSARMEAPPEDDEESSGLAIMVPVSELVTIRVSDTGIGIPVREREKVWDAFYQIDSSSTREYGGTGLGLSIVKRLVEGHGGSVRIEDTLPQGTTFVITLPPDSPT